MKKLLIAFLFVALTSTQAYAGCKSSGLKAGIKNYKSGNYTGAMQILQKVTANDPGNSLAHYYLAMCYVQVGNSKKAQSEYETVMALAPRSELAKNAAIGKNYLNPDPNFVMPVSNTGKSGFLSEEAKKNIDDNSLKNVINTINKNEKPDPTVIDKLDNLENIKKKSSDDVPTKEQIADAIQTLSKAGLNTANLYTNTNTANTASLPKNIANSLQNTNIPQINPELMQMNMLMGAMGNNNNPMNMNGGGNSMNNMLPLLMMMQGQNGQQGSQSVDPQFMQTMLSTMMMPNMMNLYENNNNGN